MNLIKISGMKYMEKDKITRYKVELPDHDYYEDEVECRCGCPVHTDARGYLMATARGDYKEGYAISRATNPFASICGKVCGAPCEKACRRSDVDKTLAIRNIKGFLTARHGPESGDLRKPLEYATVQGHPDAHYNGKTVGLIGGGVASYTCAHDLARLGYRCTIYERWEKSGGQLIQGVPINRLSRQVVQAEIDSILSMNLVSVKHNVNVGVDVTVDELHKRHDAVFIGVGLAEGKIISMDNADIPEVHAGLKFLFDFNMRDKWDLAGKRCIVIGGGDVAFDVARSALRCRASRVQMCCLEREAQGEMPGSPDEREGGRREGVIINDGWGPDEITVDDGKFSGLRIKKVKSVFNTEGRFSPEFEDEKRFIEGDILFMAVGQKADYQLLDSSDIAISKRGTIEYDNDTMMTSVAGIFVGGDVALGPKLFIDAIASGSKAALGIDSLLTGKPLMKPYRRLFWKDHDVYDRDALYVNTDWKDRIDEEFDIKAEPSRNSTLEYTEEAAQTQGSRCLECHIHPTFEGNICILCGGCVDVCPSYCLSMKSFDQIEVGADVNQLVEKEFGRQTVARDEGSVMLFDPLKCIRCGMCAVKCPTGACKMSENSFEDTFIKA
ncbi:MAG: 4Fe-4S dicluster domain-containing protein [Chitinivibrionales bacterium]|nr:4Fe-4S dicluster domain-containing protein [Chitinivibrionales bacterium]